ncbi:hypothetical protein [Endobacterium cereale]|uniref:hypothetical protein n=1 Tax=Endobacterium cereale TaxID=2663029 RepID=UPI002B48D0AC|nr:hypothetical protein [Endobacterium cereale]MEB2846812.1 hypothetical protein [Endobacterium cereale]
MAVDLLSVPGGENFAWQIMEYLLPVDGSKSTAFTAGLTAFVPPVIFFGSLMVAFYTIIGIVSSAHSGRVLGEKYHQIWAPLRVVFGFGLLVSITPTGITGVHHLERLLYMVGTNVGDQIATAGVSHVVKNGMPIVPVGAGGKTIAWAVVQADVCSAIYAQQSKRDEFYQHPIERLGNERMARIAPASGIAVVAPASSSLLPWGKDTPAKLESHIWDWGNACGSFSISAPTTDEFGRFAEDRRAAVESLINGVRALGFTDKLEAAFERGSWHTTARPTTEANLNKLDVWMSTQMIVPDLVRTVQSLAAVYDKTLGMTAAAISASEDNELKEKILGGIQTHGWTMLGSYYRMISRISEKSTALAAEQPVVREPNPEAWGAYKASVMTALEIIKTQRKGESGALVVSGDDLASVHEDASILTDMMNSISRPVLEYTTGYTGWRADPVGDLVGIGNRLLVGSQVAFTAGLPRQAPLQLLQPSRSLP